MQKPDLRSFYPQRLKGEDTSLSDNEYQ